MAVSHYRSSASDITDADARQILDAATLVLQRNDGPAANGMGDVGCAVAFALAGSVGTFSAPRVIDTPAKFDSVCAQPGIHVVDEINWCQGYGKIWLGCSDEPGRCVVVVRDGADSPADQEGILWAHELGHNANLHHPCEDPNCFSKYADRVMHPDIDKTHVKIAQFECDGYRR